MKKTKRSTDCSLHRRKYFKKLYERPRQAGTILKTSQLRRRYYRLRRVECLRRNQVLNAHEAGRGR
ncbi:hypothetical protein J6590_098429, partial [Homalodisca vitripennis]